MGIDNNIPIPAGRIGNQRRKHFADRLEVGQSYFVVCTVAAIKTAINDARQGTGKGFTRRKTVENGETGFRVWRIK